MSTKTSFKRIAAVAAVALGLGGLTAVSAHATEALTTDVTAVSLTTTNASARVGVAYSATSTYTFAAATGSSAVVTTKVILAAQPATSTATVSQSLTGAVGQVAAVSGQTFTNGTTGTAGSETGTVVFTPDVAGSYTIVAFHDQNGDGYLSTGEAFATKTITVVAGTDAVSAAITSYNTSAPTSAANGILAKIVITNSAGAAASLSAGEVITASVSGSAKIGGSSGTASVQLNRLSFDGKGRAWINIYDGTAETVTLSVTGTVGPSVTAIAQTAGYTFAAAAGEILTSLTVGNTTGVKVGTAQVWNGTEANGTVGLWTVNPLSTTTVSIASTAAASAVVPYTVKDISGDITGKANSLFDAYTTASTAGVVAISAPAFTPVAATDNFTVVVGATAVGVGANAHNRVSITATASGSSTATKDQNATLRLVAGSTVSVSAVWKDAFGVAYPNQAVSVAVTGRNAQVTTLNAVTDANGRVSFTYTDAPLAGVTATADTVTFSGPNSTSAVYTVNFVTAYTVSSVAIDTPDTTAGVANTVKATPSTIDASSTGAQATLVGIDAVVTDANGATYAGIPVTWSVAGTGAAIPSNAVTSYTDATGTATSSVYGWVAGTYTITATAGGKSSTGTITFADSTATNARIVTATANGSVVTGKVVDRYGNPVSGVTLYATTTVASGASIGGAFLASTATGADGTASWVVTGSGDVTVSAVNPTLPAGSTFGQTCAAAGKTSCASTATAILATVAGTTTTAEKYVGASYAPAGVASAVVTVTASTATLDAAQAAQDAANEATDAANAATDAANNAMDSADAAQQAAMDAGDKADAALAAVTDLATKVSEIATQISSLSAVVAKIAAAVAKISAKVKA